jgi:hypothetical protein
MADILNKAKIGSESMGDLTLQYKSQRSAGYLRCSQFNNNGTNRLRYLLTDLE